MMKLCEKCHLSFDGSESTVCPFCGGEASTEAREPDESGTMLDPREDGQAPVLRCRACEAMFMGRPGDACPKCGQAVGERRGLPWQDRGTKGLPFLKALVSTIVRVHRSPRESLSDLRPGRGCEEPVMFMAILLLLVCTLSLLWDSPVRRLGEFAFREVGYNWSEWRGYSHQWWWTPWGNPGSNTAVARKFVHQLIWRVGVVGTTVWGAIVAVLILSGTTNLIVRRLGTPRPFTDTFSVWAYGVASASVWMLAPVYGWIAASVLAVYMVTVGLSALHRVALVRAACVLALSLLVLAVLVAIPCGAFLLT